MKKFSRPVYLAAGYNTISFGSGRKEFNPKKPMPGFEQYLKEAIEGCLSQVKNPSAVDEAVISNFMAGRFLKQGNLAGFVPHFHRDLRYKPVTRVEGACGSGGMGLAVAVKSILSGLVDSVLACGFEVQNTVKALYGADILAGAGYMAQERKDGHAFFFPGQFSDRAGAYAHKYGADMPRKAMAEWYAQSVMNARKNPKAQEYHNTSEDLETLGLTKPNPRTFVEHLNFFDCSKVSDGASAVIVASEEGLKKLGISLKDSVVAAGLGQVEDDIAISPEDLTRLETTAAAAKEVMSMAGITHKDIGLLELHDCFTITALLALESIGFVSPGGASSFILDGKTSPSGELPSNTTGGLIGYGHPVGATGVRQAVDLLHQFTGKAGGCQVEIRKPYGMMVNMGGNDKTVIALLVKQCKS
ncbi:MAG: 3-ketoacyl-CoA thiolase [Elusimicrobia bacterium]|nr:3-ketoacyl-CoA thiolase [Elusimicrobiota bacterium]